jgi:hypothetical protein
LHVAYIIDLLGFVRYWTLVQSSLPKPQLLRVLSPETAMRRDLMTHEGANAIYQDLEIAPSAIVIPLKKRLNDFARQ